MSLSKSEIRRALRQSCAAEFSAIAPEEEIDYTFSPAFCEEMDDLICEQKRGSWHLLSRAKRRLLVVAAIVALSLLLVAWTPPLRNAVLTLLSDINGDHVDFVVNGQLCDELETRYTPSYLPEGFTLQSQEQPLTIGYQTTYVNASGQTLILEQQIGKWIGGFVINNTDAAYTNINDDPVFITFGSTVCNARWVHDGYYFHITYFCDTTPVDEAELVRIIASICPEE